MANYSPDDVDIFVADIPMEGFAEGEFLTIEFLNDAFTDQCGSDGLVTRAKSSDQRATATIKLAAASPSNDLLSALFQADINSKNGAGVGAFLVKDGQGRSLYTGAECWIVKHPDISFDKEPGSREWTIRIGKCTAITGGID